MSARTVSTGTRLRRQTIGSSIVSVIVATCDSGTERPGPICTCRLGRFDSDARSPSGARSTTSISWSPSRYWPIVVPETEAPIERATCAELIPIARALSWSTSMRTAGERSPQSAWVSIVYGFARITSATCSPTRLSVAASGPITRNCTG